MSCNQIQEMLWKEKGINWNDYPDCQKRGVYIQRKTVATPFSAEELEKLPEKHEARRNLNLTVERSVFQILEMPPIVKVTNRVLVVFNGAVPETATGDVHE